MVTKKEMRRGILGGAKRALEAGEIDKADYKKIRRLAWFRPNASAEIDGETIYLYDMLDDETYGVFGADFDWDEFLEFLRGLMELILEFMKYM